MAGVPALGVGGRNIGRYVCRLSIKASTTVGVVDSYNNKRQYYVGEE